MTVRVAQIPFELPPVTEAIVAAGAETADPETADAIVWTNPRDPEGLRAALATSGARWVQLPFAGIESFVEAGVVAPGRIWTCTKGVYGPATAEHALALLLTSARLLQEHARRKSWWPPERMNEGRRLARSSVVIVGTGGIGRALTEMLKPLGAQVIAVNRTGNEMPGAERTVPVSKLRDVLEQADYLVLALALTAESRHLIDRETLGHMKSDAWLINVGRGGLVDTDALVDALQRKAIGGAALDVTDPEPLPDGHPLWDFDNVIVTSHTANTAQMAIPELAAMVRKNVERFARGEELEGLVDPELGY